MTPLRRAALTVAAALTLAVASAGSAVAVGANPATVDEVLEQGWSMTIIKEVETPAGSSGSVVPVVDCDPGLSVELEEIDSPPGVAGIVAAAGSAGGGLLVEYYETLSVAWDAVPGAVLVCTVTFLVDGVLPGPEFVQTVTVTVQASSNPDEIAPTGTCQESTNPGGNVPQSGKNPKSGQNPDGFYVLLATDDRDPDPQVFLEDTGTGHVFGPYPSGQKIKYTQNRKGPSEKQMPGDILHLTGTGDGAMYAVDASGNISDRVDCLVPEPPK